MPILIRINKLQGLNLLSADPNLLRLGGGGSRLMHASIGLAWETAKWLPGVGVLACVRTQEGSFLPTFPIVSRMLLQLPIFPHSLVPPS